MTEVEGRRVAKSWISRIIIGKLGSSHNLGVAINNYSTKKIRLKYHSGPYNYSDYPFLSLVPFVSLCVTFFLFSADVTFFNRVGDADVDLDFV